MAGENYTRLVQECVHLIVRREASRFRGTRVRQPREASPINMCALSDQNTKYSQPKREAFNEKVFVGFCFTNGAMDEESPAGYHGETIPNLIQELTTKHDSHTLTDL